MIPTYVPIVKAKKGEFDAFANLDGHSSNRITPLFELPKFSEKMRGAKKYQYTSTPLAQYLDELTGAIASVRKGRAVFFDMATWAPNVYAENGEHALVYSFRRLEQQGVKANPVVGYDRWGDAEYRLALQNMPVPAGRLYCLRLDSEAIEDLSDPEYFHEQLEDILDSLSLSPQQCSVLIDFGDVTHRSIEDIQDDVVKALTLIGSSGFRYLSVAGCSLPVSVSDAVSKPDSCATVLRREMVAWRAIRLAYPLVPLVFSDYVVRNPNAEDVPAPNRNGKIRYTIDQHYFVVRGHSLQFGNKGAQAYDLARTVMASPHYRGEEYSWGDARIAACANEEFPGNGTTWVAIDSNHHIRAVLAEIFEFEHQLVPVLSATSA